MLGMWRNIIGKSYILLNYLQNTPINLTTYLNMIEARSENIESYEDHWRIFKNKK